MLSRFRPPNDDNGAFQMIALSVVCLILILMAFVFVLRMLYLAFTAGISTRFPKVCSSLFKNSFLSIPSFVITAILEVC